MTPSCFRERSVERASSSEIPHPGERPRVERKAALPAIHEREIDRVEHQNPVIAARAVRKMPLGFAARSRAISAKLAVS